MPLLPMPGTTLITPKAPTSITRQSEQPAGVGTTLLQQAAQQQLAQQQVAIPQASAVTNSAMPTAGSGGSASTLDGIADSALASGQAAHENAIQSAAQARQPAYTAEGSNGGKGGTNVTNHYHYSVPAGGLDPAGFAKQVLAALGIAKTPDDIAAMERWEAQEGGNWHNDASYNPLNTTQNEPGSRDVGTQGDISAYNSWNQGVKGTVDTLQNGDYASILQALKEGHSVQAVLDAISGSPWGTKF